MKLVLLLALLAGCSTPPVAPHPVAVEPPAPAPAPAPAQPDAVAELRAAADAVMARPEHTDPVVRVQHLLVGVAGFLPGVTRTSAEAEALTAELWARIAAGEDFDALVLAYTEDSHPGIYGMSLGDPTEPDVYPRLAMALGFGDVAWRLAVGEYGIMRYDGERFDVEAKSPFGYHILKRLE
jgi:hypothetical protein